MDFEFTCDRLSRVRDCFVFSCYTGLAYIDIYTLRREHIEYNAANGQYFIRKNREKQAWNQLYRYLNRQKKY
ncbi:MAG: hypothetical protein IPL54_11710 [Chitinophagaceae bacterium]|nr:hypothetical protein [Chitinophagaceae bacterium]